MTANQTATGPAAATNPGPEEGETPVAPGQARNADAAPLTEEEQEAIRQADKRDRTPRAPGPNTKGERVRYIPYGGGTGAEVTAADFQRTFGVKHPKVEFNFRNDVFTAPVGNGRNNTITKEVADLLTSQFPALFEYMGKTETNK